MSLLNQVDSQTRLCIVLSGLLIVLHSPAAGQAKAEWKGKKCAVVLTYDDALNVHLDNVVPILDSLGFRGTFYISGFFPSFRTRIRDWISVAGEGHELGNHTLFHPCDGTVAGREWVRPEYDLSLYTVRRIADEIAMANTLLEALDGKRTRTFAYPCGEMKVGDSSYVDVIKRDFPGARGVQARMESIDAVDLFDVGAYMVNGESGDELIQRVRKAREEGSLLVFLFHGVGGEHSLNVSLADHRQLLLFLKQEEKDVWVAPMIEIVEYLGEIQAIAQ
jgi:sialate O-acetylesterase